MNLPFYCLTSHKRSKTGRSFSSFPSMLGQINTRWTGHAFQFTVRATNGFGTSCRAPTPNFNECTVETARCPGQMRPLGPSTGRSLPRTAACYDRPTHLLMLYRHVATVYCATVYTIQSDNSTATSGLFSKLYSPLMNLLFKEILKSLIP